MTSISRLLKWASQMGMRYIAFRMMYEFQLRTGLLRIRFPVNPAFRTWISLEDWKKNTPVFFFNSREEIKSNPVQRELIKVTAERIMQGEQQFFYGEWKKVPLHDWLTNFSSGAVYSTQEHWTEIADFDRKRGDIKYVWEKSRFGFIQTILRYDAAWGQDSSSWVFDQIDSWMEQNPINRGPNYRCSQETSLRIFNWIFALYFYRDSVHLTESRFQKIVFSIYWQLRHIRSNIHFSRIAVRNNHAITETLALYTAGLLFPFFEESKKWKSNGKAWLEEEILYQIYEDGSYLQFSFNYHRVVVQLLTWAFSISRLHGESFRSEIYNRAYRSVVLLATCQDRISGELPNYGANDGSLFFSWNDESYRNFSPSLDALHFILTGKNLYDLYYEDRLWFGLTSGFENKCEEVRVRDGCFSFSSGGLYVYRQGSLLIFIPCVNYKDRPSQADNLHLDLWFEGINLLRDGGSYQYNTEPAMVKYFFGTESHNTVMLGDVDQMQKGSRFIWWHWSEACVTGWTETEDHVVFKASICAFKSLGNIEHTRKLIIEKKEHFIQVIDSVSGAPSVKMRQLWHVCPGNKNLRISIHEDQPDEIVRSSTNAYYSSTYGLKEPAEQIEFVTMGSSICTDISL